MRYDSAIVEGIFPRSYPDRLNTLGEGMKKSQYVQANESNDADILRIEHSFGFAFTLIAFPGSMGVEVQGTDAMPFDGAISMGLSADEVERVIAFLQRHLVSSTPARTIPGEPAKLV